MSLKAFHVIFVCLTTLCALGVAGWSFFQFSQQGGPGHAAFGAGSLLMAAGMIVYGIWFLKKLKHITYL